MMDRDTKDLEHSVWSTTEHFTEGPLVPTYAREAVLTIEQVAAGMQVSVKTVERAGLPTVYVGRLRRYVWGQVLDALMRRAA